MTRHPNQRSRLWLGDDLFRMVERVPEPSRPEPIPVGEAREMPLPILTEEPENEHAD